MARKTPRKKKANYVGKIRKQEHPLGPETLPLQKRLREKWCPNSPSEELQWLHAPKGSPNLFASVPHLCSTRHPSLVDERQIGTHSVLWHQKSKQTSQSRIRQKPENKIKYDKIQSNNHKMTSTRIGCKGDSESEKFVDLGAESIVKKWKIAI